MTNQPYNPPAFPVPGLIETEYHGVQWPTEGMTLRDYFAGQAMGGMFNGGSVWGDNSPDTIAENAYVIADAMLDAREGGGE